MEQKITNSGKTIAKNTIFLYFRMMFTMIVSLYTSRVILDVLGINDYGIYQTVGGVVAILSFVNNSLSIGSSRFLTYELGRGDQELLKKTFSSILTVHLILAVAIIFVAETIGLWFVCNRLGIPEERLFAAVVAYHMSVVTVFVAIVQVPFNATIIAHERMSIYAYLSILEVLLKLAICYIITIGTFDRLELYAVLLCIVQFSIAFFYRFYCTHHYQEARFKLLWDWSIIKGVLGYSGWNLFASTSIALITQGTTIIISIFFSPAVVAARAVANQVNTAANQFISNFRTAADPQIVKRFAAQDYEGSKRLLLESTKYSFYMMLILALPIYLVSEELLGLWLKEVPDYTVVFLHYAVLTSLFQVIDSSFYTALYAKGSIKENAILSPSVMFIAFPIIFLLYKKGFGPEVCAVVILIAYAIIACLIKPFLLVRIVGYTISDIVSVFKSCIKVVLISCPVPIICYYFADSLFPNFWIRFTGLILVAVFFVGLVVWTLGINYEMRRQIIQYVKNRIVK